MEVKSVLPMQNFASEVLPFPEHYTIQKANRTLILTKQYNRDGGEKQFGVYRKVTIKFTFSIKYK